MSFLEYQDEMYTNAVTDTDCLVIASRGMGIEQLMVRLCRTYSDDTSLVIVIGTTNEDDMYFRNQLIDEKHVPYGKLPERITAESSNTKKRREIYLQGGVLFVTERILVVDLLSDRVPIDLVTGIVVYRAHKVYNDCLMSFILRLYRMKNKKGFIKALSQNPQSFFGDFAKLDKIMRALFVPHLHLWPRFHASIQASLGSSKAQPEVIEINLPMNQSMKNIQLDILELIEMCLKELAKTNSAFLCDLDQLNVENAITSQFDSFLRQKSDDVWHQLSSQAKRLIHDINWLKNLLRLLTQSDSVTFYNQTRAAQNSVRINSEVSDWIFWKPADRLFKLSKERVYPTSGGIQNFDSETNLKWKAFQDLVDEIDQETKDIEDTVHVFVVVATDYLARLLKDILECGAANVLRERIERFNALMKADSRSADALFLHGLQTKDDETSTDATGQQEASGSNEQAEPPVKKRYRLKNPAAEKRQADNVLTLTQIVRRTRDQRDEEVITLDDEDESDSRPVASSESELRPKKIHKLKLHYFATMRDERVIFESSLRDYKPMHVIMYDLDMHAIRQLELYQASCCHPKRCKIYTIQFENSYDMQQYLTTLRREKEAFENLIREKATMTIPTGRDGKTDGHPDLVRGGLCANETTDSANTRRAGGQVDRNDIIKQKVLVDMREFRCELPSVIHKRGIEIEPIQLEIGDYILTSNTCVERKSISDLIQSLQSGRLYNQAAMMIRHFKRSILLIEFDEKKSFHFKGRYWGGAGGYTGPRSKDKPVDLVDKLILLTIHHPNLRLIWSPDTHFTAGIFEDLKMEQDQPDAAKVAAISSNELPAETFEDRYDIQVREFLLKLPGVNTRNVYALMSAAPTLADLVEISIEELHEIMLNSRSAELFHQTLHTSLRSLASEAIQTEQANKKTRLFSCTKKRKGLL